MTYRRRSCRPSGGSGGAAWFIPPRPRSTATRSLGSLGDGVGVGMLGMPDISAGIFFTIFADET